MFEGGDWGSTKLNAPGGTSSTTPYEIKSNVGVNDIVFMLKKPPKKS